MYRVDLLELRFKRLNGALGGKRITTHHVVISVGLANDLAVKIVPNCGFWKTILHEYPPYFTVQNDRRFSCIFYYYTAAL